MQAIGQWVGKLACMTAIGALMLAAVTAQAEEVYRGDRFTVRKLDKVCKVEINIHGGDMKELPKPAAKDKGNKPPKPEKPEKKPPTPDKNETVAILALFADDGYFSEFFMEKNFIGKAKDKLQLGFDQEKMREIAFTQNPPGQDNHWRWQYLEDSTGLLDQLKQRKEMILNFSNGKHPFKFVVPLGGGNKAVTALRQCAEGKPVKVDGKSEAKPVQEKSDGKGKPEGKGKSDGKPAGKSDKPATKSGDPAKPATGAKGTKGTDPKGDANKNQ